MAQECCFLSGFLVLAGVQRDALTSDDPKSLHDAGPCRARLFYSPAVGPGHGAQLCPGARADSPFPQVLSSGPTFLGQTTAPKAWLHRAEQRPCFLQRCNPPLSLRPALWLMGTAGMEPTPVLAGAAAISPP